MLRDLAKFGNESPGCEVLRSSGAASSAGRSACFSLKLILGDGNFKIHLNTHNKLNCTPKETENLRKHNIERMLQKNNKY